MAFGGQNRKEKIVANRQDSKSLNVDSVAMGIEFFFQSRVCCF
jgi:hypothetical protein